MSKGNNYHQVLETVNSTVYPRFLFKEQLKESLALTTDPISRDQLEHQILLVRNEIIKTMLKSIPDFFESVINQWSPVFRDGETKSYVYENLLEAVKRYNPNVKPFCKFTTFFWMYNQNILRNRIKQMRATKRDVTKTSSLDALSVFDQGNADAQTLCDRLVISTEDMEDRLHSYLILKELYKNVSFRQRLVLKRLYLGYRQSEIAKKLNVTSTNINVTIRQLRKILYRLLGEIPSNSEPISLITEAEQLNDNSSVD